MAVEPVGTKNDWEVNLLGAISATDIISIIKKETLEQTGKYRLIGI